MGLAAGEIKDDLFSFLEEELGEFDKIYKELSGMSLNNVTSLYPSNIFR